MYGKHVEAGEGAEKSQIFHAGEASLLDLRAAPSGLSQVRHLPDLLPQVGGRGGDSRGPQSQLVTADSSRENEFRQFRKGQIIHMMTDPIADMLTRIRNAVRVERPNVDMPTSKVKRGLAEVLKREGYIWDWKEVEAQPVSHLRIDLKYGPNGERVIRHLKRVSTPGAGCIAARHA